jgi:hypothetical protein
MNATQTLRPAAPQPLLSLSSRIAAAAAVAGVMVLASMGVQQASHEAVHTATETFARGPSHITLAPVQVVGRRAGLDAKSI